MTDEELVKEKQIVGESLADLAGSDKPLTPEEKRQRDSLTIRKLLLERIQEARAKQRMSDELYHSVAYSMFMSRWGKKHPFLTSIILRNFRWSLHYQM